jgi:predicted transglutaminase-like cysteine proteinase
VALKNQILEDKFFLTPNWMALRDWVGTNIQYRYDSEAYGREHWQLPKETISMRRGDCEDFSILLCSLLRADGWSSNNAFVIVGENNGAYHAWVRIIWNGIEYNIEPQVNGWNTLLGDFLDLSGYSAKYRFNDNQFGRT